MANDATMFNAIKVSLDTGFAARGIAGVTVQQAYQPTQQGVPQGRTVLMSKVGGDVRFGFLRRESEWDRDNSVMVHTEQQFMESLFQINALSIQEASVLNGITASDLCNAAASILQSDATRAYLRTRGLGVLRVTAIRNPYFVDDKERFEASPSFDIVLTHNDVQISTSPVVETVEYDVKRV